VTDPILLFLTADIAALLGLGLFAAALPPAVKGFPAMMLSGLGALLCLPPLILRLDPLSALLPFGPPGFAVHVALDPLSAFFLLLVFLAGTALHAFQAAVPTTLSEQRAATIGLAGTALALIGADATTVAAGLMALCLVDRRLIPVPFAILAAICLCGFPASFGAIRESSPGVWRGSAAAALTLCAAIAMTQIRNPDRCWTRDAVSAGIAVPLGLYLLARIPGDLCGPAARSWWGSAMLAAACAIVIPRSWQAATALEADEAMAALSQRQAGLGIAAAGLMVASRAADFPVPTSRAVAALCLIAAGSAFAGTLAALAGHVIGAGAGTYRLSRMGGLIGLMPGTSAALGAALFALSALPPGLGFASLWLLIQAILSAPRADGVLGQLPLVAIVGALAVSAALTTAASVRVFGITALGRPRTPRGSGADEAAPPIRNVLLIVSGAALAAGVAPEPFLWLLATPVIGRFTGLSVTPGYNALAFAGLFAVATGAAVLAGRIKRPEAKLAGVWADGMRLPYALPFGEPNAQATGEGFLPPIPGPKMLSPKIPAPKILAPDIPGLPGVALPRLTLQSSASLVAAAFGIVLAILASAL
jgi:formate hydrogenlyase subunit 3/multisubunit Na+/H+ antiporter MnhD subunit